MTLDNLVPVLVQQTRNNDRPTLEYNIFLEQSKVLDDVSAGSESNHIKQAKGLSRWEFELVVGSPVSSAVLLPTRKFSYLRSYDIFVYVSP